MARTTRRKKKRQYSDAKEWAQKTQQGSGGPPIKTEGVELFIPEKKGFYKLDILPYEVGEGNPACDSGILHFERTYWVHNQIGPKRKKQQCLAENHGEACPVCEDINRMNDDPEVDQKDIKDLLPKKRQLFNVRNREEGAEIQVWEISYFLFGALLAEMLEDEEEGDDYGNFYHLEGGYWLRVKMGEESMGTNTFLKAKHIDFRQRTKDLPDSILDKVYDLDDLVNDAKPDYEELKDLYFSGMTKPEEDEEDEEKPKRRPSKKGKRKPEPEPEEEEDLEDDEGWFDDEDEEDEKPKRRPSQKRKRERKPARSNKGKRRKPEPEEEDEEEFEDDEELEDDDELEDEEEDEDWEEDPFE